MQKLAIVSTHPIQYNAPWFALLAAQPDIDLKVFYTWSQAKETVKDKTFGRYIQWDIPLLEGYAYEFVENVAKKPGSHHFLGIDNPELITKIKAFSPDAILVFGWNFKSHLNVLRHFKGKVPLWFRGDSTLLDETPNFKRFLRRQVLRWVYRHIDLAFYVGSANEAYFNAHGLPAQQLVYAPHAIDNTRFAGGHTAYETAADQWRSRLGYTPQDIVMVFAGKLEAKKQPDFLIAAFKAAQQISSLPLKLLLVGEGPLKKVLELEADAHIQFLPFQNQTQMPLVYRLGDVLCLPSKGPGETWGLAINEAMACGRPVIVSDKVGCATDLVLNQGTGYVFKHDSLEALTSICVHLNSKQLKTMGAQAKTIITTHQFKHIVDAISRRLGCA